MTPHERVVLAALGLLALLGLGICAWQQRSFLSSAQTVAITSPAGGTWDQALAAAQQVDVNTATVAQLERLPGIGPILAQRIIEERQAGGLFRTPADLRRVKGLGRATMREIVPFLIMSKARPPEPMSDPSNEADHQQLR